MRAQFVLSEIGIGLRRNLTMTIAVIVSAAVALGMLGVALLLVFQVSHMKDYWYDKVEVTVYMCTADGPTSDPKHCANGVTPDAQVAALKTALTADPLVEKVYQETQLQAFQNYQTQFKGRRSPRWSSRSRSRPRSG